MSSLPSSPLLAGAKSVFFHFDGLYTTRRGRINFLAMKCVWDENSPKRTQARTPLHPSPAGRRPPTRPSRDAPALLLPRTRRGLVAIDKGSYRFGRSPSGRPARRLSELTSTRAGGNLGGPGRRGSRAALRPALPASAARPIVAAIWPAKAALPPRPPPLPRLKL